MKNQIKYYLEDVSEVSEKIKNKITILNSPLNILNKRELSDLNNALSIYTEKYDHYIKSIPNELITKDLEEIVLSLKETYNHYKTQVEKLNKKLNDKAQEEEKNTQKRSHSSIKEDSVSDFSDYPDEKIEIKQIFLNSVITTNHIQELKNSKNLKNEKKLLADIFSLKEIDPKDQILIDFYVSMFKFCIENKFTNEKSSTMISIVYFMFNYSIMNKKLVKEKSLNLFLDIMEFHSLNRVPYSYEIFNYEDKLKIIEYVKASFYRNFTIFENIFKYNINIYLKTTIYDPLQQKIEKIQPLKYENKRDINAYQFIKDMYQIKEIEHKNEEIVVKSEVDIYEEMQLERLKTFVNTFYKSKNLKNQENEMLEQQKQEKLIEDEVNEAKKYLENVVPEILKETDDKIKLSNHEIMKNITIPTKK